MNVTSLPPYHPLPSTPQNGNHLAFSDSGDQPILHDHLFSSLFSRTHQETNNGCRCCPSLSEHYGACGTAGFESECRVDGWGCKVGRLTLYLCVLSSSPPLLFSFFISLSLLLFPLRLFFMVSENHSPFLHLKGYSEQDIRSSQTTSHPWKQRLVELC